MRPNYDERSLVRRVSEGDEKAFSELYDRHKPALYRFVFNILKSADQTNDACQDVFIKIWEDRVRLAEILSFKHYLLTVGKNHSLNMLKKIMADEKLLCAFVSSYNELTNELEDEILSTEYKQFIASVFNTLTPQSQRIFQLCRQQGMSYDEAAGVMGVSRNIIKKHMVRSMKIFRDAVEKDLGIAFNSVLFASSIAADKYFF